MRQWSACHTHNAHVRVEHRSAIVGHCGGGSRGASAMVRPLNWRWSRRLHVELYQVVPPFRQRRSREAHKCTRRVSKEAMLAVWCEHSRRGRAVVCARTASVTREPVHALCPATYDCASVIVHVREPLEGRLWITKPVLVSGPPAWVQGSADARLGSSTATSSTATDTRTAVAAAILSKGHNRLAWRVYCVEYNRRLCTSQPQAFANATEEDGLAFCVTLLPGGMNAVPISSAFFDDLLSSPAALLAPQPSGNNDAQGLQIGVARWGHITGHGPACTVRAHLPSRARDCCLRAECRRCRFAHQTDCYGQRKVGRCTWQERDQVTPGIYAGPRNTSLGSGKPPLARATPKFRTEEHGLRRRRLGNFDSFMAESALVTIDSLCNFGRQLLPRCVPLLSFAVLVPC